MNEYPGQVGAVFAWTDSSIVLAWLRNEPSRWPVFVANRVAQNQRYIPEVTWNHMSSHENPTDVASRGTDPQTLHHQRLWWDGPEWLTQPMEMWPVSRCDELPRLELNQSQPVFFGQEFDEDFTLRFSCLTNLLRAVARCSRMMWLLQQDTRRLLTSPLSAEELDTALLKCTRFIQRHAFPDEITALMHGRAVGKRSPLRTHRCGLHWTLSTQGFQSTRSR